MKNIHVLPTDKPSRLVIDTIENKLYYQSILHNKTVNVLTQNIYITSDEEIKEGDWFIALDETNDIYKADTTWIDIIRRDNSLLKKIILTTDQDLIEDGVQAIDDEFLEWFVKNPSCERVDTEITEMSCIIPNFGDVDKYKIIIPKEEPKQKMYSEEEVEDLIYKVCGTVARLQGITLNSNHIDSAYRQFKKK